MAISIRCERLVSLKRLRRRVFINFILEKLLSTEAVAMEMDRLMVASVFKFGNILLSISFVANSFNYNFMFSLDCLAITDGRFSTL